MCSSAVWCVTSSACPGQSNKTYAPGKRASRSSSQSVLCSKYSRQYTRPAGGRARERCVHARAPVRRASRVGATLRATRSAMAALAERHVLSSSRTASHTSIRAQPELFSDVGERNEVQNIDRARVLQTLVCGVQIHDHSLAVTRRVEQCRVLSVSVRRLRPDASDRRYEEATRSRDSRAHACRSTSSSPAHCIKNVVKRAAVRRLAASRWSNNQLTPMR